jgi:hypothetical protein
MNKQLRHGTGGRSKESENEKENEREKEQRRRIALAGILTAEQNTRGPSFDYVTIEN